MVPIGELDLPDRLAPRVPRWVTQCAVGGLCALAAGMVRMGFDWIMPGSAPFALVFPVIMLATLFARWEAGALTAVLSIAYAWRFVFPAQDALQAVDPTGARSALVVAAAAGMTIWIAEAFRRAVRRAAAERDREIADRELLLEEFDHRVKNNFAIVASLLDLQRRRAAEAPTVDALTIALNRVESIARAHGYLYRGGGQSGLVEMQHYLADLCSALSAALFAHGGITLTCHIDDVALPRDRAVSIGLVVNELVTNAAKHAFAGRESGTISVSLRSRIGGGWLVVVQDDGNGFLPGRKPSDHGLGSRLIEAFSRQAGGTITTESDPTGTRVTLKLGP